MASEEEKKKQAQADRAAATMFNVFPQGTGAAVRETISPAVQGITNAFTNFTSGPLIRTGGQRQEPAIPTVPTLPSGRPATGFDIYPTTPQMPPTAPKPLPYGSPLGPSIYTQTPTQTNLQTGMGGNVPAPSGFSTINPPAFPVQRESISRLGLMGGVLPSGQVGPLPMEQITPMTAGQRPIIESGPVSMGITATQTPEQRGLKPVQNLYGTVYATAQQQQNMQATRTMAQQSSRSPAEQRALLAQMRERGAAIGQRLAGQQEQYFQQVRAERAELARSTQAADLARVPQETIRQARSQYLSQQPSSIAGIQRQFAGFLNTPSFGETPMSNRTAFVRSPFNIPAGGPQPTMSTTQPNMVRSGMRNSINTTQRSWDNYEGSNPIESRVGSGFYDRSRIYGPRRNRNV
jgi:hypothetical protein